MKTNEYVGTGGLPLTGSVALASSVSATDTSKPRQATEVSGRAFPLKLLATTILVTAVTVAWTSFHVYRSSTVPLQASVVVSGLLLCFCLVSWLAVTRSMLVFSREAMKDAGAAARMEAVLKEQALMRLIIDTLPDAIYAKDTEAHFILNNVAHAKSIGGGTPAAMFGKTDFDYFPKELATQFYNDEKRIIETGVPLYNQEQYKATRGTTEKRWSYTSKVIWRDPEGKIIGTVGVTRDIHEMKMAQEALRKSEEKLRQFTMQLERSNRELQDFAYVASHDLQEPLRKIVVFGERLKEKCSETLSDEGRDYLTRMQKAASRMQVLITDLLSFSRVTTKAQPFTRVDMAEVAHDVVSDLEARIELVKGRVEVGQLPVIEAEPLQMRQILQNLIGNALKFRRAEEPPVVKVNAQVITAQRPRADADAPLEELCEMTVSDNGIGFEEKYLDRIFNVFQRLHTRNEYEGTGMGLAIARKIAVYHGGDITAKSKPGHGSTFIVTLPVSHPKEAPHE